MSIKNFTKGEKTIKDPKKLSEIKVEEIKIDEVIKDDDIYPRLKINHKAIDDYVEKLKIGEKFDEILVQKIKYKEEEDDEDIEFIVMLDGYHRNEAKKIFLKFVKDNKPKEDEEDDTGIDWNNDIKYVWWRDEVLDKKEYLNELRIESIKRNLQHGISLKNEDKKNMCEIMAEEDVDMDINEQEFAEIFKVSQQTINNWIGDIRARQRGSRDNLIYRLAALGWTHQDIGDKVGLKRPRITQIVNNTNFSKINLDYKNGKKPSELAKYYGFDIPMIWHILLDDVDDSEKFDVFFEKKNNNKDEAKYRVSDMWNFINRDVRLGIKTDGNIAGQIPMNLLYYYTKQGDNVLDPMAGGGSTIDACLVMGRKCMAYDINPKRDDIIENNSVINLKKENKILMNNKKFDFVFIDPPYFNMVKTIQNYHNYTDFLFQMTSLVRSCVRMLKDGGHIALLMTVEDGKQRFPLGRDCENILKMNELKYKKTISAQNSTQVYTPTMVISHKKIKRMISVNRQIYVYQK